MEAAALAWAGRSMTDVGVCALASRAIGRLPEVPAGLRSWAGLLGDEPAQSPVAAIARAAVSLGACRLAADRASASASAGAGRSP